MRVAPGVLCLFAVLGLVVWGCGDADLTPVTPDVPLEASLTELASGVETKIDAMEEKVDGFHTSGDIDNDGVAEGMKKLLSNAGKAAGRDDMKATENMMGAFKNRVHAQRGRHIREAAADELSEDAQEVIDLSNGTADPTEADLGVSLAAAPDPAVTDEELEYTLILTNPGPADVTDVELSLLLLGDVDPASAPSECADDVAEGGLLYDCTIEALDAGADTALTVVVVPRSGGDPVSGQADIVDWSGASDPDLTNNISTTSTDVNSPPVAVIELPLDRSLFLEGDGISFSGSATDPEDEALPGASLAWTSSIDGEIGTGESFDESLSVGEHVVTLTATDEDGASADASVALEVVVPGSSEGASLSWERILAPVTDIHMPLRDVWVAGPEDVYAVGNACGTGRRAILHFDGDEWSAQPTEFACPNGVWSRAPDDVFVLAGSGRIRHFDGANWSEHETSTTATIQDAWGSESGGVWAVGDGVILHYDGNASNEWTVELTRDDVDGLLRLSSIWGSSSSDIYAVGPGSLWHYDGSEWSPVSTGFTVGNLSGVWGSGPDDVFAVGQFNRILHWDGTTWSEQTAPPELTNEALSAVAGNSSDDVYAVGSFGTIIHYDGASWTRLAAGGPPLNGIAAAGADGVFAVGNRAFILKEDAGDWKLHSTGVTLHDVWAAASDDVFAVGSAASNDAGMLLHFDGADWTIQNTGLTGSDLSSSAFRGIWGASADDVWAVGSSGRVVHFDGSSWNAQPVGTSFHLESVWGSGSDDVFIVGTGGTLLQYDGTDWTPHTPAATTHLRDVFGVAADAVWVVGASGTIFFYDGDDWTQQRSGQELLNSVWALSSNHAFVGTLGKVLRWDGSDWTEESTGRNAHEMWGASLNDVFGAAHSTSILHFDGTSWTAHTTPARQPCCQNTHFGIWGLSATEVFAVGGSGMVVRSTP